MPLSNEYLKQLILSSESTPELQLIDILRHSIQSEDGEKTAVASINNLLSTSKTRLKGLQLLTSTICYYSLATLTENALNWVNCCTSRQTEDNTKQIKLDLLTKIVEVTYEVPAFNKTFISNHMSYVLKTCLAISGNGEIKASLYCLMQCMQRYGSWFGNHRSKVEVFLLNYLESSDEELIKAAAITFHYFHQTGPAGIDGDNYINNFFHQFKRLCSTLHSLYDSFFDGTEEIDQTGRIDIEPIKFQAIPANFDSQKTLNSTAQKIMNCLVFLKVMIVKKYPVAKKIIPKYLVDVISRGMSLHICLSEKNMSMELNCLSLLLNKIQIKLLEVLRPFIIGHLPSLLPFSYTIIKLLVNAFKRTQQCSCFATDNLYREVTCKVLNDWIKLAKCGFSPQMQEILVGILFNEILPNKTTIVLNINKTNTKKSAKAKRKATLAVQECLNNDSNKPLHSIAKTIKENNCIQALNTLTNLLTEIILKINDTTLQNLYKFVITTLLDIQASRELAPYNNPNCQVKLYRVLVAFYEQHNVKELPSTQIVIEILKAGLISSNQKISVACSEGLNLLEKICQPMCPSLFLSDCLNKESEMDLREISENSDNSQNIFDENKQEEVISQLKKLQNVLNGKYPNNCNNEEQSSEERNGFVEKNDLLEEKLIANSKINATQENGNLIDEPPHKKLKTAAIETWEQSQLKDSQNLLNSQCQKDCSNEEKQIHKEINEIAEEKIHLFKENSVANNRIEETNETEDINNEPLQDDLKSDEQLIDDGLNEMLDAFEDLVEGQEN